MSATLHHDRRHLAPTCDLDTLDLGSERVARLVASQPPPVPLRAIRAEVAAAHGLDYVGRAWTCEPPAQRVARPA